MLGTAFLAFALVAGCGGAVGQGGQGAQEGELTTVTVGTVSGSSADAAMFTALEKGFFEEQGIDVELRQFDSGARMVAPLGSGQLDVGSGGISAGLFNAIADGVGLRIVADKARVVPPGFVSLLVRKELVESGAYGDFSDLEGRAVAVPAKGVAPSVQLQAFLEAGGLGLSDIRLEEIGFASQIPALTNGSIDAAISIEPSTTKAVRSGAAVRVARTLDVLDGLQTSGILYSDAFAQQRELATRYMTAYLKGVRFYNDALVEGKLSGSKGDEVARILLDHTQIEDSGFYKEIALHGVDPNGESKLEAVRDMLQFFQQRGQLDADVAVDAVMERAFDPSFREAAVEKLGPYEAPTEDASQ